MATLARTEAMWDWIIDRELAKHVEAEEVDDEPEVEVWQRGDELRATGRVE